MKTTKEDILRRRLSFSKDYPGFSVIGEKAEFNYLGCECCLGGAGDTYQVEKIDTRKRKYDGNLCSGCICSLLYDDDSDLDYHFD